MRIFSRGVALPGLVAALMLPLLLQAFNAAADREASENARERRFDRAAPPEKALRLAMERFPGGRVLKMELEDEDDDGLVYELKILTPEGRVVEWVLKAEDLSVIRERGREKGEKRRLHP